ncbi:hypothetical protein [Rhodococcus sp. NPDC057529]|uniref:hypothetical protein n=1 Tax=Rhodococcus sp. NPDC057529 TaxID=3346158 RepID=UPI00366FD73C
MNTTLSHVSRPGDWLTMCSSRYAITTTAGVLSSTSGRTSQPFPTQLRLPTLGADNVIHYYRHLFVFDRHVDDDLGTVPSTRA